jgi:acylphosphatase
MILAVHITVKGTVQGVAFRYHTQLKAQELGLQGKVRNEKDGSVTAIAEGPHETILKFIEWCHHGPTSADVQEINYHYTTPKPYLVFVIER